MEKQAGIYGESPMPFQSIKLPSAQIWNQHSESLSAPTFSEDTVWDGKSATFLLEEEWQRERTELDAANLGK